jgi:hypothetical protein
MSLISESASSRLRAVPSKGGAPEQNSFMQITTCRSMKALRGQTMLSFDSAVVLRLNEK